MPETAEMTEATTEAATEKPMPQEAPIGNQPPAQGQTSQTQSGKLPQGEPSARGRTTQGGQAGQAQGQRGSRSLLGGSPFAAMRQLADEMDRLFESFGLPSFGLQRPGLWSGLERGGGAMSRGPELWAPQIDVTRRGNDLVVCADLPGMRKEDINIEIREDQLVLEGERRQESEGEEGGVYRSERSYGRFYRAIPLPDGINPEQARANFKDGVLEIRMPLPQQPEQRGCKIEVR